MGALSPWHIAIVVIVGLLVFGPKKLPELGRGVGSGLRDFRKGLSGEADAATVETPVAQAAPVAAEAPVTPAEAAPAAAAPASAAPASAPTSTVATPAE